MSVEGLNLEYLEYLNKKIYIYWADMDVSNVCGHSCIQYKKKILDDHIQNVHENKK